MRKMPFWAAVQTQPQRDRLALHFLAQAGFETYAPRIRGERLLRGRAIEVRPALLFCNYIFVLIVAQWHIVNSTHGVRRLICDGGRPAHVSDHIIEALRAREGPDGLIRLPAKPAPRGLLRGDRLHVVRGAFTGLDGFYQGQAPRDRIRILLTILGAARTIELPSDDGRAGAQAAAVGLMPAIPGPVRPYSHRVRRNHPARHGRS